MFRSGVQQFVGGDADQAVLSEGVILPKELLNKLNLQAGDALEIRETGGGLTLTPVNDAFERQMEAARKVMNRYKVALQKLAE